MTVVGKDVCVIAAIDYDAGDPAGIVFERVGTEPAVVEQFADVSGVVLQEVFADSAGVDDLRPAGPSFRMALEPSPASNVRMPAAPALAEPEFTNTSSPPFR